MLKTCKIYQNFVGEIKSLIFVLVLALSKVAGSGLDIQELVVVGSSSKIPHSNQMLTYLSICLVEIP